MRSPLVSLPPMAPRKKRAQSLVELAVTIPVMAILLLGGFDCTMLIWDKLAAGYAVRQGVRLASELGGRQTNPTATQAAIDKKIARNVLAITKTSSTAAETPLPVRSRRSHWSGATRLHRTRPRSASACTGDSRCRPVP